MLPGLRAVSEGHCHAGYSDDDPENASAALGWQSKQAGFPQGEERTQAANGANVAVKGLPRAVYSAHPLTGSLGSKGRRLGLSSDTNCAFYK